MDHTQQLGSLGLLPGGRRGWESTPDMHMREHERSRDAEEHEQSMDVEYGVAREKVPHLAAASSPATSTRIE